jgi:hypothetical protein
MGRLGAEQPVEDERHGALISPAVAPEVQHHAAGPSQQRERGLEVGRRDVHAVKAVEGEHAHAVGTSPDVVERCRARGGSGSLCEMEKAEAEHGQRDEHEGDDPRGSEG